MSENNSIQKRPQSSVKEKGQYLLAFGVVGSMLLVAGFPVFVIFFFALFAYFVFRIFASGGRNETRHIFEFYVTANEILRDDGRNWFGFEIRDAIAHGESIVQRMVGAPPLVHFALGALYNKAGDHQAAINSLTHVVEGESGNEASYVFPSQDLRNYVKVLRKIERDPSEAPLTSASIRALERARRLRGKAILEESRAAYLESTARNAAVQELPQSAADAAPVAAPMGGDQAAGANGVGEMKRPESVTSPVDDAAAAEPHRDTRGRKSREKKDPFADRKPITEVLHDIYDKNVQ